MPVTSNEVGSRPTSIVALAKLTEQDELDCLILGKPDFHRLSNSDTRSAAYDALGNGNPVRVVPPMERTKDRKAWTAIVKM